MSFLLPHSQLLQGDLSKVKRCIEEKADVCRRFLDMPLGSTPLHWAAAAPASAPHPQPALELKNKQIKTAPLT
jgi:hypothetical protein